jgi:hypothetical protein
MVVSNYRCRSYILVKAFDYILLHNSCRKMFLSFGLMAIGPKRSGGRPGAKGFVGVSKKIRRPRWLIRQIEDNEGSSSESSESIVYDGLPEKLAAYNPNIE